MLRRLVPVPIKLVLILVGNDVHIASMEFLECFSYSRLLIINNQNSFMQKVIITHIPILPSPFFLILT